jgi:hypothetical protein
MDRLTQRQRQRQKGTRKELESCPQGTDPTSSLYLFIFRVGSVSGQDKDIKEQRRCGCVSIHCPLAGPDRKELILIQFFYLLETVGPALDSGYARSYFLSFLT